MPETINRNLYDCRTMKYYRNFGGIYQDVIEVLDKMYADSKDKGMLQPIKLLNSASYWKDKIELNDEGKKELAWLSDEGDKLMLCVLGCIGWNNEDIQKSLKKNWVTDETYYPFFKPIMDKWASKNVVSVYVKQNEELAKTIEELNEKLELQRGVIGFNNQAIDYLLSAKGAFPYDLGHLLNWSDLDRYLTFASIMKWIKEHPYPITQYVIAMLEHFMDMVVTTDSQRTELKKVKEEQMAKADAILYTTQNISNGGIIVNNADQPTINANNQTKGNGGKKQ